MKYALITAAIGFTVLACQVDASGNSGGDDDGTSKKNKCEQLAEKCPYCTLPDLKETCQTAVRTRDEDSCQSGLDNANVQADCVPKNSTSSGGTTSSSGGTSSSSGGGTTSSSSSSGGSAIDLGLCPAGGCTQVCAEGQQCEAECAGGNCTQTCSTGAICEFTCAGGNCTQSCAGGAECSLTCSGANCTQSCVDDCEKTCYGGNCD